MNRRFRCAGKPVTLVLLAGGKSRRMKQDKALLPSPEKPLLHNLFLRLEPYFDEVILSVSKGQRFDFLSCPAVADEVPDLGPIGGLRSGLKSAANETCAVIACDIPEIDICFLRSLIREAADFEIAVPQTGKALYEPLLAVYKKAVIPAIDKLLASGERSIIPLFDICRTRRVQLDSAPWLKNLNSLEDYRRYLATLSHK